MALLTKWSAAVPLMALAAGLTLATPQAQAQGPASIRTPSIALLARPGPMQRGLVHHWAPAGIDQHRARLHQPELAPADQVPRAIVERHVEAHHVGDSP